MGMICAFTSLTVLLSRGPFSPKVLHCWGAMVPAVVVGAPLGSIILKPAATPYLRVLFYVMAFTQFTFFAALKIKASAPTWVAVSLVTVAVLGLLAVHYTRSRRVDLNSTLNR